MCIDINAISLCLDLNIFQQDECFCSKLGLEVEYAKSNLKTSLSQNWVSCHLLPFVRVGQSCLDVKRKQHDLFTNASEKICPLQFLIEKAITGKPFAYLFSNE